MQVTRFRSEVSLFLAPLPRQGMGVNSPIALRVDTQTRSLRTIVFSTLWCQLQLSGKLSRLLHQPRVRIFRESGRSGWSERAGWHPFSFSRVGSSPFDRGITRRAYIPCGRTDRDLLSFRGVKAPFARAGLKTDGCKGPICARGSSRLKHHHRRCWPPHITEGYNSIKYHINPANRGAARGNCTEHATTLACTRARAGCSMM